MSTPMASPAHQADQTAQNRDPDSDPFSNWTTVPVVELMTMPPRAPRKTRATPSRRRSSSVRKPTARRARKEQSGASVLPAVMARPQKVRPSLRAMTVSSAPSAMPGQIRVPRYSRDARAIPEGGQRGVTTEPSTVTFRRRPSRPEA